MDYSDMPDLEEIPASCGAEDWTAPDSASITAHGGFDGIPELEKLSPPCRRKLEVGSETSEYSSSRDSDLSSNDSGFCKVVIRNFPYGITEAELMNLFAPFHPIKCIIMINAPTPIIENLSYAFVYFPNDSFGEAAENSLNLTLYRKKVIQVLKVDS